LSANSILKQIFDPGTIFLNIYSRIKI